MPDIETAADNARSRKKTGLPALEGDAELILYYYLVMHPNTESGREMRVTDGKEFRVNAVPNLKQRFPNEVKLPQWVIDKMEKAAAA